MPRGLQHLVINDRQGEPTEQEEEGPVLLEPGALGIETGPGSSELRLIGEMDAGTVDLFVTEGANRVIEGHRDLTLLCSQLTFCDSYGLRAMTRLADGVHPDGSVTIVDPSSMLIRMLGVTGLTDHFEIAHSVDSRR